MRSTPFLKSVGAVALALGMFAAASAQHNDRQKQGRRDDRPPPQQQQRQQQQQQPRTSSQARVWQQKRGWTQQGGGWQGQKSWQQTRAQRWDVERRSWVQRGGYGGYLIPQSRFQLSFGIGHSFRLRSRPTMYRGFPRFQYGGFSFLLVDPWPEYWADDWYGADDLYIDYDDGYYLYNRRHPGVAGLAITVVL